MINFLLKNRQKKQKLLKLIHDFETLYLEFLDTNFTNILSIHDKNMYLIDIHSKSFELDNNTLILNIVRDNHNTSRDIIYKIIDLKMIKYFKEHNFKIKINERKTRSY